VGGLIGADIARLMWDVVVNRVKPAVHGRLMLEMLRVETLDDLVGRLPPAEVRVMAVAQQELATGRRMGTDSPAPRFPAVVLPDELVSGGAHGADEREFPQIRPDPGPEAVPRAGKV